MLEAEYSRVQAATRVERQTWTLYAIATDGWKKRVAAGGVPLINIMLLGPRGGVQFIGIRSAAGVNKDYSEPTMMRRSASMC
eukprot:21958-Chlamydomonas_euryale.AAC.1